MRPCDTRPPARARCAQPAEASESSPLPSACIRVHLWLKLFSALLDLKNMKTPTIEMVQRLVVDARQHRKEHYRYMQAEDYKGPFSKLDPEKLGLADELISVRLNVEPWLETKNRSWSMHRTQINPDNPMAKIPRDIQRKWRSYEYFQLAATRVGPDVEGENDLFART